jgi:hypothetical protein
MKKDPLKRTVSEWLSLVDWDLHRLQPYVVVDPLNPSELLYMNKPEYLSVWKVAGSRDLPFIVIAGPKTARPSKSTDPNISDSSNENQNSPWDWRLDSSSARKSTLSWEVFCNFKRSLHLLLPKTLKEKGLVAADATSIGRSLYLWARELAHYAEMQQPSKIFDLITPLVLYIERLYTHNGAPYAISAFKVMLFTLYTYMMGAPLRNTDPLGTRIALRNGLPACWGTELRNLVRGRKNLRIVRILASLLNIYRALDAEHPEPSVTTIIQPHPNFEENLIFHQFRRFCEDHWPALLGDHINGGEGENLPYFRYSSQVGLNIRTAGANGSSAMASLDLDARALELHGKDHVRKWFELHKDLEALQLLDEISKDHHWGRPKLEQCYTTQRLRGMNSAQLWLATRTYASKGLRVEPPVDVKDPEIPGPILGRLHPIPEAAGKVRVVAIVDYFTQIAMKPVHSHLLSILRKIKTDATFDQSGRVNEYYNCNHSRHWSYDLKAATDLIPRALYLEVLTPLLVAPSETGGEARKRAELWVDVMSDREFLSPSKDLWVKYGTGLPMGAYSHWASMALVHHALVQFAWFRVNGQRLSWYMLYIILGDDLDIAKYPRVAEEYLAICQALGIQIGLHKSLQSNLNAFEFANRRFIPAGDISPLSLKEELAATSWSQRVEYAKRILERMGTSLKNSALAQVRKMVTFSGWTAMKAELAGLRHTAFLPTIRFIAGNPFRELKWNIPIESLVNWLILLLPSKEAEKVRKLTTATMFGNNAVDSSKDVREAFIAVLYTELAKGLAKDLNKLRSDTVKGFLGFKFSRKDPGYLNHLIEQIELAPREMFNDLAAQLLNCHPGSIMYLTSYFSDHTWASYLERLSLITEGLTPTERRLGSYASIVYMFWVCYRHNFWLNHKITLLLGILEDIQMSIEFEFSRKLNRTTLNFEDPITEIGDDLFASRVRNLLKENIPEGETPPHTVGEFLNWMYISYISLPKPLIIDLSETMDSWNSPEPIDKSGVVIQSHKGRVTNVSLKDLGESLKGPLGDLVLGFTKGTGVLIPPIPKLQLKSDRNLLQSGAIFYRNYIEAPPRLSRQGIFFESILS